MKFFFLKNAYYNLVCTVNLHIFNTDFIRAFTSFDEKKTPIKGTKIFALNKIFVERNHLQYPYEN